MARTGHNLRTSYLESNEVLRRPYQKILVLLILLLALFLPAGSSKFFIHLLNLSFLAAIGALGLMILTGYCGQISLGHAAFPRHRCVHHGHPYHPPGSPIHRGSSGGGNFRSDRGLHRRSAIVAVSRHLSRNQHARDALRHHLSGYDLLV
jgi:hypothetical protein